MNDFDINILLNALSLITLLAGGYLIVRSKTTKENISQQKELIETLTSINATYKSEIVELRTLHIENTKAIANLQGQVEIYKDLQLKSIAETNRQILDVLSRSALIASNTASGGGMLVQTKEEHPLDVKVKS